MTVDTTDHRNSLVLWWTCDHCGTRVEAGSGPSISWWNVRVGDYPPEVRHACSRSCARGVMLAWADDLAQPVTVTVQPSLL